MTKLSKRREFSDTFKLQVLSKYFSGGGSKLSVARKYRFSHNPPAGMDEEVPSLLKMLIFARRNNQHLQNGTSQCRIHSSRRF